VAENSAVLLTGTLIAVGVIATEVTVPVPPFLPPPPPQAVRIKAHAIANAKKDGARALFSIWKSFPLTLVDCGQTAIV
jgi:hypothetical protein